MKNNNGNAQEVKISQFGQFASAVVACLPTDLAKEEMQKHMDDKGSLAKLLAEVFKTKPPVVPISPLDINSSIKILGADKVLTAKQVCKAWNIPISENVPIRYSETTLREKAEQNKKDQDWRLVYIIGYTLNEQYAIMPAILDWRNSKETDRLRFHYWDSNDLWWERERWAYETPSEADNYILINFKALFGNLNYHQQERQIQKFDSKSSRTNPHIFIEAICSLIKIGGERIAEGWFHRSNTRADNGGLVCATDDHSSCGDIKLEHSWGDVNFKENLCVSLSRNFDF